MIKVIAKVVAILALLTNFMDAQNTGIHLHVSTVRDSVDEYDQIWIVLSVQNNSDSDVEILDYLTNPTSELGRIASITDSLKRSIPYRGKRTDRGEHTYLRSDSVARYRLFITGYGVRSFFGNHLPHGSFTVNVELRYRILDENGYYQINAANAETRVFIREIEKSRKQKISKVSAYCTALEDRIYGEQIRTDAQWEERRKKDAGQRHREEDSLLNLQIEALRGYFLESPPSDLDYDITKLILFRGFKIENYELIVEQFIDLYERHKDNGYTLSQLFFYQIPFSPQMIETHMSFMKQYIAGSKGTEDRNAEYFKRIISEHSR